MNKNILKLVRNISVFLVFSLLIYIVLLSVFGETLQGKYRPNLRYKLGHNNIRLNDVKIYKDIDVLFLGSSHAYRGFDTRIFKNNGYTTFNMGSSAQTPIQTKVLLERYLDSLNPKLVVFEVYPVLFTTEGVESSLDILANDDIDFESFKMTLFQNHIKVYNTFLYSSYKNLFYDRIVLKKLPLGKEYKYHEGGYVSRDLSYFKFEKQEPRELEFNKKQFDKFESIIKMLTDKNINYILVQAPITSNRYNSFLNNDEFNLKMKTYGPYYNFNELIHLNDSLHFYDSHHLNQNGVNIFNKAFMELVIEKQ